MRLEAGETEKSRIDKTKGNHRGRRRRLRAEEQREFVYEITVRGFFPDCSLISLSRKQRSTDRQFPAEIVDLLGLGFEIPIIEVPQDEIKNGQLRADVFDGMLTAIAEIFAAYGAIHKAREKMVDASVPKQQTGCGMPLSEHLLGEGHALIAAFGSRECQVLASGKIPRMGGHEIQETSLVLGVSEAA